MTDQSENDHSGYSEPNSGEHTGDSPDTQGPSEDTQSPSSELAGEETVKSAPGGSEASSEDSPSKLPGEIPLTVWDVLRGPFDRSDVRLIDVQVDPKHGRGLARPVASEDALITRLNTVLGPEGWSVEYSTEGPEACRCRLYIGSAFRDAIAEGTGRLDTCLQALRLAAREFGIGVGLHGPPNIYIEKDENGNVTNFDQIIEDLREVGTVR